jgi:hypothetical protein
MHIALLDVEDIFAQLTKLIGAFQPSEIKTRGEKRRWQPEKENIL